MARGRPRKTPVSESRPPAAASAGAAAASPGPEPAAPRAKRAKRAAKRATAVVPFPKKLVLNQWMLSLFGVERFDDLAEHLRDANLEGLDADNIHHFHKALALHCPALGPGLTVAQLLDYDQNIVRHTQRLNEARLLRGEDPIVWKYFQYLALLFTEIYLDWYFHRPAELVAAINASIEEYNSGKEPADCLTPLDAAAEPQPQLNKLAHWMATGAGKTLVMHANILQYKHYLEKTGRRRDLNRIILLTPNEGLSQQHLREFQSAGIDAEIFNKDGRGLFAGKSVEILEVTRLRDDMGEKTVAVDAFEGNNLVLVDEGHRGTSGGGDGAWMRFRTALCEKGFSFEYSATFGQAVKGSAPLTDLYAKNILVDYSYRYFYEDGFGKDYQILNLDADTEREHLELYLVACLLSFYQQQRLYRDQAASFRPFNIEKPLWIFVGGSVTATLATRDASDIVAILQFLGRYVGDRAKSIERIGRILSEGLLTATGANLFARRFEYLAIAGLSSAQVFDETLQVVFNAPGGGQLYVEDLKGATGEVALRLGADNEAFGVINVGDSSKLVNLCKTHGLETGDREFKGSLFHEINQPHSTVNVLIGSKKFTEGWSSWRVSTMGLMNVGQGEGAQIIQLFGRGVRLKGHSMSLKRSGKCDLPEGVERPKHVALLETLGIFGIKADYMAQFRDFLEDEGLSTTDDRDEFLLPVIKSLGTQKLRTIRLKKTINGVSTEFGDAFRKLGPVPTVRKPDATTAKLRDNRVFDTWYPRIQAKGSAGLVGGDGEGTLHRGKLTRKHVAALDIDRLWFELERYKAERGWYNLNISREEITDLLLDPSWYDLEIPEAQLAFDSWDKLRLWEQVALGLLKKYTEKYYRYKKQAWEAPHLEYRDLEPTDPNFLGSEEDPDKGYYRILYDRSREDIVAKLEELKGLIEAGTLKGWSMEGLKAINVGHHLYQPLLHLESNVIAITPAPLNKGEWRFVQDMMEFADRNPEYLKARQVYLLRNLSRGRGVGFFEAGNFHPDFITWVVEGSKQHITFVDPKGIRNLPASDDKIRFCKTIKDIEARLADPDVTLSSFIVSNTPSHVMEKQWGMKKVEMAKSNIVFQEEDKDTYVATLLSSSA
jgi:hypothetical protein